MFEGEMCDGSCPLAGNRQYKLEVIKMTTTINVSVPSRGTGNINPVGGNIEYKRGEKTPSSGSEAQ